MTEQVQEQFSDSSHATEARMGFFEKTLYSNWTYLIKVY